jgi:hypothetical protein
MRIQRRKTAERYGVSVRSIERWEADPALGFPRCTIINGRRYDDVELLDAWDRECAAAARGKRRPVRKIAADDRPPAAA